MNVCQQFSGFQETSSRLPTKPHSQCSLLLTFARKCSAMTAALVLESSPPMITMPSRLCWVHACWAAVRGTPKKRRGSRASLGMTSSSCPAMSFGALPTHDCRSHPTYQPLPPTPSPAPPPPDGPASRSCPARCQSCGSRLGCGKHPAPRWVVSEEMLPRHGPP